MFSVGENATRIHAEQCGRGALHFSVANAELGEFALDDSCPVSIGHRIGGARVEDASDPPFKARQSFPRALLGKTTDAENPLRIEGHDEFAQELVAEGVECFAFMALKFVGCEVASTFFKKKQRAIVRNEVIAKETLRCVPVRSDGAPKPPPAHFTARTSKSLDRFFGIFVIWFSDGVFDLHPVAYGSNFAKGNTRLRHAERSRIHTEHEYFLS